MFGGTILKPELSFGFDAGYWVSHSKLCIKSRYAFGYLDNDSSDKVNLLEYKKGKSAFHISSAHFVNISIKAFP
jgi:hypothetical protein